MFSPDAPQRASASRAAGSAPGCPEMAAPMIAEEARISNEIEDGFRCGTDLACDHKLHVSRTYPG